MASAFVEQIDPASGQIYYANTITGESHWTKPPEMMGNTVTWSAKYDSNSQKTYYLSSTGQSEWTLPEGAVVLPDPTAQPKPTYNPTQIAPAKTSQQQVINNDISSWGRNDNPNPKRKPKPKPKPKPKVPRPRAGCCGRWSWSLCPLGLIAYLYLMYACATDGEAGPKETTCSDSFFVFSGIGLLTCLLPMCYAYHSMMGKLKVFEERIEKGEIVEDLSVQKARKRFHIDTGEIIAGKLFEEMGVTEVAKSLDDQRKGGSGSFSSMEVFDVEGKVQDLVLSQAQEHF